MVTSKNPKIPVIQNLSKNLEFLCFWQGYKASKANKESTWGLLPVLKLWAERDKEKVVESQLEKWRVAVLSRLVGYLLRNEENKDRNYEEFPFYV